MYVIDAYLRGCGAPEVSIAVEDAEVAAEFANAYMHVSVVGKVTVTRVVGETVEWVSAYVRRPDGTWERVTG